MKTRAWIVAAFMLVSSAAFAGESARAESTAAEAPRVMLDNVVGIRLNAMDYGLGQSVVTGGPLSGRLFDASNGTFRSLRFRTEVDGRVWKSVTLGGAVGFSTHWGRVGPPPFNEQIGYSLAFAPRIGALLPLAPDLYLWPRVGPAFAVGVAGGGFPTVGAMTDLSLVAFIHRNVFVAFGPRVEFTHEDAFGHDVNRLDISFGSRLGLAF
ncbi:MAG: hypothetical protein U0174_13980 [Polyangiaceae bacterium]